MIDINRFQHDASCIRRLILDLAYKSGGGQHLGGGLSMVEVMCALYGSILNISPESHFTFARPFILSKGHEFLVFSCSFLLWLYNQGEFSILSNPQVPHLHIPPC